LKSGSNGESERLIKTLIVKDLIVDEVMIKFILYIYLTEFFEVDKS
jgi:hypothetical protein